MGRVWFTIVEDRPSKREVVRSLMTATDNETVEQDVERDYNKLARHPKGKFTHHSSYILATIQQFLVG